MEKETAAEKIRAQYEQREHTELDELKALDARVKKPARVAGAVCGGIGIVVMGAGMSLIMTDIGTALGMSDTWIPGIVVGVVGMVMSCAAYPIYNKILNSRKKKYSYRIMELSDRIMKG